MIGTCSTCPSKLSKQIVGVALACTRPQKERQCSLLIMQNTESLYPTGVCPSRRPHRYGVRALEKNHLDQVHLWKANLPCADGGRFYTTHCRQLSRMKVAVRKERGPREVKDFGAILRVQILESRVYVPLILCHGT